MKNYLLHSPRIILGIIFALSGIGKFIDHKNVKYLVDLMASIQYWVALLDYRAA